MSSSSRIGGSGFQGGQGGTGKYGDRSPSLDRFCKNRRVGDVVSGTFLRLENESLGWALLDGEELLAHLPENPKPRAGERIFFRVESLVPEVVLRMLSSTHPMARLAGVMPPLPLAQEAALYIAARDKLDGLLSSSRQFRESSFFESAKIFSRIAAQNNDVAEAFAESFARSRALERAATSGGLLFFRHMPWLCPQMTSLEVSLWSANESPIFARACLPSGEMYVFRGSADNGTARQGLTGMWKQGGTDLSRKSVPDIVGRILFWTATADGVPVGRFSRTL